MKNTFNALLDPLIMQSSFVENSVAGRSPIIARSGSELWYLFVNVGIPLIVIIVILLILRMRYNQNKEDKLESQEYYSNMDF
jgi:hypothetical protein